MSQWKSLKQSHFDLKTNRFHPLLLSEPTRIEDLEDFKQDRGEDSRGKYKVLASTEIPSQ